MSVVKCNPTSPGRRHVVKIVHFDLHKGKPYGPLLEKKIQNWWSKQQWTYHHPPYWWWS